MKLKYILCCLLFFGSCFCIAQNDSLPNIAPESLLKEGVYLTFNDLKTNNPLPKENIVSTLDKTLPDFISKTLTENKEIIFSYKGSQYRAEVSKIWGYCQNGNVYVQTTLPEPAFASSKKEKNITFNVISESYALVKLYVAAMTAK